jgi:hypothetical protein
MVLRKSEIITLLNANTVITEMPITQAGANFAVTANTEQIPSTCTTTGLFFENGLKNTLLLLIFSAMTVIYF